MLECSSLIINLNAKCECLVARYLNEYYLFTFQCKIFLQFEIEIQNSARNLISSQNNEDEKATAAMRWNNNFRKHFLLLVLLASRFKVGAKKRCLMSRRAKDPSSISV